MGKKLLMLVITLLAFGCLAWAAGKGEAWTGTVSDEHCGLKHATASEGAAACVEKCVSGGAKYTLVSGGKVYQVEPQDKFKGMGGKSVKVSGHKKAMTITAESVEAAM